MPQRTAHLPTNALLFRSQLGRTSYTEGKLLLACPVCNCRRQLLNAEVGAVAAVWCVVPDQAGRAAHETAACARSRPVILAPPMI
eukprot:5581243-Pleurochrysis_carterae.AAC.1